MSANHRVIEIPAELAELPVGTVVLDKEGKAWQRYRLDYGPTSWGAAGVSVNHISWGELLVRNGPMTVIHEGGDE